MQSDSVRHLLRCSVAAYWRCVLDAEYNRQLYLNVLRYRAFEPLSLERTAAVIKWTTFVEPTLGKIPEALARVVKWFGDSSCVETASFDVATQRLETTYATSAMREKTSIRAEVVCEEAPHGACERVQSTLVEVRALGIGGLLEKAILSDMHRT